MLDPAIIAIIEAPAPPGRPVLVNLEHWQNGSAVRIERAINWMATSYEQHAEAWLNNVVRLQEQVQAVVGRGPLDAEGLGVLLEVAERYEHLADERARDMGQIRENFVRDAPTAFGGDRRLQDVARLAQERCYVVEDRLIDATLEFALFLRALKAEHDPEARGGPTFSRPGELADYLRKAIAS